MTDLRWAWAEIDLGAIAHNVRELKGFIPQRTMFMAVVKADGYGHGAVEVAEAALAAGADRLGVATVPEGVRLRQAGVSAPINLLSEPPVTSIPAVLDNRLVPAVTTLEFAESLGRAAAARSTEAPFHLKIDTGMNRIGVAFDEAPAFAASLSSIAGLSLEGTFTHFATADVVGDWDAQQQLDRFRQSIAEMRTEGVDPGIVHAANSPATVLMPGAHFDMVRCGIALYGLHPSPATRGKADLRPAMSIKARVAFSKRIGIGDGVSYGLTYRSASPACIATLPLGYADGVHRVLSNRMQVLVQGRRVGQVGRVCMDQLMIEIPRGMEARRGEEAVIVGSQLGELISMDELAEQAGTINYELACAFGQRLERIYLP